MPSMKTTMTIALTTSALVLAPLAGGGFVTTGAFAANGHANSHASNGGGGGSHGKSGGDHGNSGGSHGNSGQASTAGANSGGTNGKPKSAVRQYVIANDLKQGDVARVLKSWNSLNRNPQAFLNNLDNPSSLPGKQSAYVCDNASAQTALSDFTTAGGDPTNPPSQTDAQAAQDYLDAWTTLGTNDLADVLANSTNYDPSVVDAANLINGSTFTDQAAAQTVVDQYNAYTTYQTAEAQAETSFMAASVSYSGDYNDAMAAVREKVDGVIATKNLDTSALCGTTTTASN